MAFSAATAYVDVKPDLSNFGRSLTSGVQSQSRTMGSRLKSTGAFLGKSLALGAGAAIAGAAVLGKMAVEAAIEAEKIAAQTEAVLKSTGGAANITAREVENLGLKIQNYSGISDEAVTAGSNMLLTFTNIRNEAGKGNDIFNQSTEVLADMSVALGTDMKTSAIQLGKALNDPIAGVSALTRVGVTFDEQTKANIEGLVNQGKTMEAQKIILKELNKEFGGSARAMGKTAAGQFNIAKEAVGNVMEEIGGALLPTIAKLGKAIAKFVGSKGFQDWMKDATRVTAAFVGWLVRNVPKAFEFIGKIIRFVRNLFGGLNESTKGAQSVWGNLVEYARKVWPDIRRIIVTVIKIIRTVIGAMVRFVRRLWKDWGDEIMAIVRRAFSFIGETIQNVLRFIKGTVKLVLAVIKGDWSGAWKAIKMIVGSVWEQIKDTISNAFGVVREVFGAALSSLRMIWTGAWNRIKSFLGGAWEGIKNAVRNGVQAVANFFRSLPGKVINYLKELPGKMLDLGKSIIDKLIEGIKSAPGMIADAVQSLFDFNVDFNPFSGDGPGFLIGGGSFAGGNYPPGTAGGMAEAAMAAVPGAQAFSSQYRPNDVGSYHAVSPPNNAVDVSGAQSNGVFIAGRAIAGYLISRFGVGAFRELIHTPLGFSISNGQITAPYATADHYDHVHVADKGGVYRGPGLVGIGNIDEAVFQPAKKVSELSGGRGDVHLHGDFRLPGEYVRALDWYDRTRSW